MPPYWWPARSSRVPFLPSVIRKPVEGLVHRRAFARFPRRSEAPCASNPRPSGLASVLRQDSLAVPLWIDPCPRTIESRHHLDGHSFSQRQWLARPASSAIPALSYPARTSLGGAQLRLP